MRSAPKDAWAIDHQAHVDALAAARAAGVTQVVLLSAICVQKPLLAFQQAKLAFEKTLIESGLDYSIVRATAFFKSLSGQIERVRAGKPFLVFGDGTLTACKPISDDDLGDYLADCLHDLRQDGTPFNIAIKTLGDELSEVQVERGRTSLEVAGTLRSVRPVTVLPSVP